MPGKDKKRKEKQKAKNKKTTTTKLLDSPGMKPAGTASKTRVFPHRQDGGKIPGGFLRGWGGACVVKRRVRKEREYNSLFKRHTNRYIY